MMTTGGSNNKNNGVTLGVIKYVDVQSFRLRNHSLKQCGFQPRL
jgi:hypothetical protein